jgi:predicted Fe-Mo cluster-binding NifX family protein
MRIALASQNRRSLTAHAGKCRHFFLVDTTTPGMAQSLELSPAQVLHVWPGEGPHPLEGIELLVAASIGSGVVEKLSRRGIRALATPERELSRIVEKLLDNSLPITPIRTEADARSQPGACLPILQSGAQQAILGGNHWSASH